MYELIEWFKGPCPTFIAMWQYFLNTGIWEAVSIIAIALVVIFFLTSCLRSAISVRRSNNAYQQSKKTRRSM